MVNKVVPSAEVRMPHGYHVRDVPDSGGFSVGVFQWECRDGRYCPGRVLVRVHGTAEESDAVYAEARRVVKLLDMDRFFGPKNIRL